MLKFDGQTALTISWSSAKELHHTATFRRAGNGSRRDARVMVETRQGREPVPCRVEIGLLSTILPTLTNPAGRYRLAPMLTQTLESVLDNVFNSEPELEAVRDGVSYLHPLLSATLEPVKPGAVVPNIHPTMAPFLGAFAPVGSVYRSQP